jgi:hypothetical protein
VAELRRQLRQCQVSSFPVCCKRSVYVVRCFAIATDMLCLFVVWCAQEERNALQVSSGFLSVDQKDFSFSLTLLSFFLSLSLSLFLSFSFSLFLSLSFSFSLSLLSLFSFLFLFLFSVSSQLVAGDQHRRPRSQGPDHCYQGP